MGRAQMSQLVPRSYAPRDLYLQPLDHPLPLSLHATSQRFVDNSYHSDPEPAHVAAQPKNLPRVMAGKQLAVIVRQYNKEDPVKAVEVIEKNVVDVGAGTQLSKSPLPAYSLLCRSGMLILMHRKSAVLHPPPACWLDKALHGSTVCRSGYLDAAPSERAWRG